MVDYCHVMRLLLRGESYRLIQARTGAAPATISKAKKSMDAHGIVDEAQVNDLNSEDLPKMVGDKRSIAFSDFVPIEFDAVAAERVGRKKTPLNVLWSNYVATPTESSLLSAQLYNSTTICIPIAPSMPDTR